MLTQYVYICILYVLNSVYASQIWFPPQSLYLSVEIMEEWQTRGSRTVMSGQKLLIEPMKTKLHCLKVPGQI